MPGGLRTFNETGEEGLLLKISICHLVSIRQVSGLKLVDRTMGLEVGLSGSDKLDGGKLVAIRNC